MPPGPHSYVGVDIGTSVTKAVLFDEDGEVLAATDRRTHLFTPGPEQVEQDIEDVLRSVTGVIDEVLAAGAGTRPARLALTGQGDGCWLADPDGRAVRPAISWLDGRGAGILARWEADGTAEAVYRLTGNALFPGAPGTVLRWLDDHEPAALDRAATAGYCKDLVMQRLTGLRATDPSDASLPFGDPAGPGYCAQAIKLCGLERRATLLPPVAHPLPAAPLSAEGAALTGLPAGTPVSSGPFDLPACAIGAGAGQPGDGVLIIGTTLACQVLTDHVDTTGPVTGMHLATGEPGRWLRALPAMVGTASIDWVLGILGMGHDEVGPAIEASRPGAAGVEVLPYLAPSGERAPFVNPAARGQFTGLQLRTTRADILRGVCEGIAFAARDCFEAAAQVTGRLLACGGGVRSRAWLQIFADVLGQPLHIARAPEAGARGAVLAGLRAAGQDAGTERWTTAESVIDPDPAAKAQYDDAFGRYREHRAAAEPMWRNA
ncbi:MAG: carbohydrate kinase [Nocardiopsaceae bacterium]|nr:carbohydrate kinase [Nocardiopsaceae bacterium]